MKEEKSKKIINESEVEDVPLVINYNKFLAEDKI